ncbi:MAG: HK97 family phage prohead protease, partial [Acidobacteria bacterium]|nr:HK97 family phage prohead protease [Acidobacteriota bacterium]
CTAVCRGCRDAQNVARRPGVGRTTSAPAPAPKPNAPPQAATRKHLQPLTGYVVLWGDEVRRELRDPHHCGTSGPYSEAFGPFAFRDFLRSNPEVVASINHEPLKLRQRLEPQIGSTRDGSLRLWETEAGLAFALTPYDNGDGQRAVLCAQAGSIHGVSPTWTRTRSDFAWHPSMNYRTITRSELREIAIVIGSDRPSFPGGWAGLATPENQRRVSESRGWAA